MLYAPLLSSSPFQSLKCKGRCFVNMQRETKSDDRTVGPAIRWPVKMACFNLKAFQKILGDNPNVGLQTVNWKWPFNSFIKLTAFENRSRIVWESFEIRSSAVRRTQTVLESDLKSWPTTWMAVERNASSCKLLNQKYQLLSARLGSLQWPCSVRVIQQTVFTRCPLDVYSVTFSLSIRCPYHYGAIWR